VRDFWLSCGHHLTQRGEGGGLVVSDEFLRAYLARPELNPPDTADATERGLHRAAFADPRRPVAAAEIAAITDPDARENWALMTAFRDRLLRHPTLEAGYLDLVRNGVGATPPLFLDQLVHVILRNALDGEDDPFVLRAAELFFRPQRLALDAGALIAADAEAVAEPQGQIDVMTEDSAGLYWQRSDRFDMAFDLSAGGRGSAALGTVIAAWLRHLLSLDASVEPLRELRDVRLTWYVGLDADGTRLGDALWRGEPVDDETRPRLAGLFRLRLAKVAEPIYLILSMTADRMLRMKPQNLLTGLPAQPR